MSLPSLILKSPFDIREMVAAAQRSQIKANPVLQTRLARFNNARRGIELNAQNLSGLLDIPQQKPVRTDASGSPVKEGAEPSPFKISRKNGMIVVHDLPIVDEHDVFDEDGKFVTRCDKAMLESIASNNNRRIQDTGDETPITVGHTKDDAPEDKQPKIVGYANGFHVAPLFNTDRQAIFVREAKFPMRIEHNDFLAQEDKCNCAECVLRRYPRRSVEIWFDDHPMVDPIALLGPTTPERDLGLIKLSKLGKKKIRYSMALHPVRRAAEDWRQETGERQGKKWVNIHTGAIEYGENNPGGAPGQPQQQQPQQQSPSPPQQGQATPQATPAAPAQKPQQPHPTFANYRREMALSGFEQAQSKLTGFGTSFDPKVIKKIQDIVATAPDSKSAGLLARKFARESALSLNQVRILEHISKRAVARAEDDTAVTATKALHDSMGGGSAALGGSDATFNKINDHMQMLSRQSLGRIEEVWHKGLGGAQRFRSKQQYLDAIRKRITGRVGAFDRAQIGAWSARQVLEPQQQPQQPQPVVQQQQPQQRSKQASRAYRVRHNKKEIPMGMSGAIPRDDDDLVGRIIAALQETAEWQWIRQQMSLDHESHEMEEPSGQSGPVQHAATSGWDASGASGVHHIGKDTEEMHEGSSGIIGSSGDFTHPSGPARHAKGDYYDPSELMDSKGSGKESSAIERFAGPTTKPATEQPTVGAHRPNVESTKAQYKHGGQPVRRAASGTASGGNTYVPGEVSGDEANRFEHPSGSFKHPPKDFMPKKGARKMQRVHHQDQAQEEEVNWDEVDRLRQENESLKMRMAKVEQNSEALVKNAKKAAFREAMARREQTLTQLEAEGYDIDRVEEMKDAETMTSEHWDRHVARIRKRYSKAPGFTGFLPVTSDNAGPTPAPKPLGKDGALQLAKAALARGASRENGVYEDLLSNGVGNEGVERVN